MKRILLTILLIALFAGPASAAPVLCFSDLVNGPKTGLGDGLGSGAIVTVWGWNLGDSQGTSTITIGGVTPVYIYYWKSADGTSPGGPAQLHTYHKMQEIAFSVPASVADGAVNIQVVVSGVTSNTLSFTVAAGDIFWVGDTPGGNAPNDTTGNGSFASPWATLGVAASKAGVGAGDIIYGYDSTEAGGIRINAKDGAENSLIAVVSYPGHMASIGYTAGYGSVTSYAVSNKPDYWVFSKLRCTTLVSGIVPFCYSRVVGNEIWDGSTTGNTPNTDCAEGSGGAITYGGDPNGYQDGIGAKIFGNYIHDWGCASTSNQHHTVYFSVRNHGSDIAPHEMAWNYFYNNHARQISMYDEHQAWGYTSQNLWHHNVVNGQAGGFPNIGCMYADTDRDMSGGLDFYSNLIMSPGQTTTASPNCIGFWLYGDGIDPAYTVNIYNNTYYSVGDGSCSIGTSDEFGVITVNWAGWSTPTPFAGSFNFKNNIVFDINDIQYTGALNKAPESNATNVWYNGGDSNPSSIPSWASGESTADPVLVSAGTNFALQTNSPALTGGSSLIAAAFSDYGVDGSALSGVIGAVGGAQATTRSMGAKPGLLP